MGLFRTLLLGDLGNYLDNEDNKRQTEKVQNRLRKKDGKDRQQDEEIEELVRENIELKYTVSALIRLLHEKEILSESELVKLSNIEQDIELHSKDHDFNPNDTWSNAFKS
ncbi:MAG: hypothetical protein COA79_26325 [Planctomycetota bacterium]|nr:MAG: hypothetical protein COA79_26325 [Planctomycetota bacterium]